MLLIFCSALDEDVEIELVEDLAPFLASHSRQQLDLSPVKIVKVRNIRKKLQRVLYGEIPCYVVSPDNKYLINFSSCTLNSTEIFSNRV